MNIGSQIPPINCSIFEVMNHLKTYSSRTELMNTHSDDIAVALLRETEPEIESSDTIQWRTNKKTRGFEKSI